jgi:cupin fold WbuC family metalloprotein
MKSITSEMLDELEEKARTSPRLRSNLNIHTSASDPVQRYFIAAERESYFRPHRHPDKSEFALVIRGDFDVLMFDDNGSVTRRVTLGPDAGNAGVEMPANTWHTWIPVSDRGVFFEVKQGPYDAASAAEFAPWSPEDGAARAEEFVVRLRHAKPGDNVTD